MNDNKQEDDMVGVIAGKCVLTDSQGVTHEGVVEDAWCEPCGNGWRSEASVTVVHEPVKPRQEPLPQVNFGAEWGRNGSVPKPPPQKMVLTPHGRQCAAREALVAARAAESDAVRDAMIDLALRLLGGADEQP
jgi:hypothetical protein